MKIGGSLLKNPKAFTNLFSKFDELVHNHQIVILPGGGEFADQVRKYHSIYKFSDTAAHYMAITTEDIIGILIKEYLPEGELTYKLEEVPDILKHNKIAIFLPSRYLIGVEELPHSWDVTSDSIAIYLANKLHFKKVILVKDVDGLYTNDPKSELSSVFIKSAKASELKKIKGSCVDNALGDFIKKYKIICYLINGNNPERINLMLEGQETIYSLITP